MIELECISSNMNLENMIDNCTMDLVKIMELAKSLRLENGKVNVIVLNKFSNTISLIQQELKDMLKD